MDDKGKLETLAQMAKTMDLVHTCQTKAEFDAWLANQSSGTPLAGVFAIAGFNYAMRQVQQVLEGTHPSLTKQRWLTWTSDLGTVHATQDAKMLASGWQDYIWHYAENADEAIANHDAKLDERASWINAGNPEKDVY